MGEIVNGISQYDAGWNQANGKEVVKEIALSANNTTANVNVFRVYGTVEILSLEAMITDATTLTNCTAAHFQTWDGTSALEITNNDGVLSGLGVGTYINRIGAATATMNIVDNAAGAISEGAAGVPAHHPFIVSQKTGVATYIRFSYATTDAPADATLMVKARFRAKTFGANAGDLRAV